MVFIIKKRIIALGANPVSGGTPARDKSRGSIIRSRVFEGLRNSEVKRDKLWDKKRKIIEEVMVM